MDYEDKTEQIKKLRLNARRFIEVADLLESLPDEVPFDFYVSSYAAEFSDNVTVEKCEEDTGKYVTDRDASIARIAAISKLLPGKKEKEMDEYGLTLIYRTPSGAKLEFTTNKEVTCTKKVLGKRQIPARTIAAYEEEIVEWECDEVVLLKSVS